MSKGILNSYSDVAFANIVKNSNSYSDCVRKLGYKACTGVLIRLVRERIKLLDIDISHFVKHESIKRSFDNVFCKNSTAKGKVLRKWYKEGNYTPYICAICGQEPFWNGKEMSLILDHINGINNDHRLENLRWVCPNCNIQLETSNGKNKIRKERKIYYCCDCGTELKYKNSTRCTKCHYENVKKQHIVDANKNSYSFPNANKIVYREELKELIRTKPFTQVGTYYGVTDNTVRKWCKIMNLPSKSSIISNISDEDWNSI